MSAIGSVFKWIGKFLDRFRKVLHFIFLFMFFAILVAGLGGGPKVSFGTGTALLLNPSGALVNQLSGDPVQRSLDKLSGNGVLETLTRDVVRAIQAAKNDKKIKTIVLDLDAMAGAGLTDLQLIADALADFKQSGKKIFSFSSFYTQGQYMLAAHADEVYMHPSGFVFIDGFGRFRQYYKDGIEKLSIDWNVFKVGEFKSFVEPYIRNDMSPEDRASSLEWMNQLWSAYQDEVVDARGLERNAINQYANNIRQSVEMNNGDLAMPALDAGLVDDLILDDEFDQKIVDIVGVDEQSNAYNRINLQSYLQFLDLSIKKPNKNQIGIVVASGEILNGMQPPGTIGGRSMSNLLRKARFNKDLDALVVYVDSGGGSKFASELIQRELKLWKKTNRPLVTVMSSVAASGGYWIAMDGDEIWASPNTITGSIGIGGYIPTFQRSLARLGVNTDGVGTTRMSGTARVDRALGEDVKAIMQKSMEHGYLDFISTVAEARGMTVEDVDKIARGRVWSGKDAMERGLVDRMGTLDDAVKSAASLAGISDDYAVVNVERDLTFEEQLTLMLSAKAQTWTSQVASRSGQVTFSDVIARLGVFDLEGDIARLTRFNDPKHLYVHCFCRIE